jgi:hypothetical protein
MAEKNKNEERNWEVNYELGILDPMVEDLEQLPGGRMSRENEWYPLKNEWEMQAALMLVEKAEILTKGAGSFGLWWLRSWENRKLGENRYLSYLVMMLQGCPNVIILLSHRLGVQRYLRNSSRQRPLREGQGARLKMSSGG